MKILSLRFKNLNSLYGEWSIDFSESAYAHSGIFAMTGPTGAGKSTILDAICLGLFGSTPRLGKITQSSNEIMSRQTGECFAEVTFASQRGRFRAHWSQRRARGKAGGRLQDPRHEIADADSGKVLENKLRQVVKVVEEATGLDFERFLRSVLLAQGGFDTFLKANVEEKSRILEQITGTEIYSEISKEALGRWRHEQQLLEVLTQRGDAMKMLEPADEASLRERLAVLGQDADVVVKAQVKAREQLQWCLDVLQLRGEVATQEAEERAVKAELEVFAPEVARIETAQRAAVLDGQWDSLQQVKALVVTDEATQRELRERQRAREAVAEDAARELEAAERDGESLRAEHRALGETLKEVMRQDVQLSAIKEQTDLAAEGLGQVQQQMESVRARLRVSEESVASHAVQEQAHRDYSNAHRVDASLASALGDIKAQAERINGLRIDVERHAVLEAQLSEELVTLDAQVKRAVTERAEAETIVERAMASHEEQQTALEAFMEGQLLREWREKKDSLLRELGLRRHIASLEQERARLRDGEACPLCGATAHPFAQGNVPLVDETEAAVTVLNDKIECAEGLEASVVTALELVRQAEQRRDKVGGDLALLAQRYDDAGARLNEAQRERATVVQKRQGALEGLQTLVVPFDEGDMAPADVAGKIGALERRWDQWLSNERALQRVAEARGLAEKDVANMGEQLKGLESEGAVREQKWNQLRGALAEQMGARRALFGERRAAEVEAEMTAAANAQLERERARKAALDECRSELARMAGELHEVGNRVESERKTLVEHESKFTARLVASGFADEASFLGCRMERSQLDALMQQQAALTRRQTAVSARGDDRRRRLVALETVGGNLAGDKGNMTLDVEVHRTLLAQVDARVQQLQQEMAEVRASLAQHERAKQALVENAEKLQWQRAECARWEKLYALIGSGDGRKFRNFAQGLTFERMVVQANKQLAKMTDRYLLVRSRRRDAPLELDVVDSYQAGMIRSVKNLSGGESFVVSLSLALGLSQMSSSSVKVDSLFLDEGFGTLDDAALEMALDTLAGLAGQSEDSKLIGVISHVHALKNRVGVQVEVRPATGGRAELQGPGVMRLSS